MEIKTKFLLSLVALLASGYAVAADFTGHPVNMTFGGSPYQAGMLLNGTKNANGDFVVRVTGQGFATVSGLSNGNWWLDINVDNTKLTPANVFRVEAVPAGQPAANAQATACVSDTYLPLLNTDPVTTSNNVKGCTQLYSVKASNSSMQGKLYTTTPIGLTNNQPNFDLVVPAAIAANPFIISWQHLVQVAGSDIKPVYATSFSSRDTIDAVDTGGQTFSVGATWNFAGIAQVTSTSLRATVNQGVRTGLHDYSLTASYSVASADFGKIGQVWVAVLYQGNLYFHSADGSWTTWDGSSAAVPTFANVTLANGTDVVVAGPIDARPIEGAQVFVAYGVGTMPAAWSSMVANKSLALVETLAQTQADINYQTMINSLKRWQRGEPVTLAYNGRTITISSGQINSVGSVFSFCLDSSLKKINWVVTTSTGPLYYPIDLASMSAPALNIQGVTCAPTSTY